MERLTLCFRSAGQLTGNSETKTKSIATTNGHLDQSSRNSLHNKDPNKDTHIAKNLQQPRDQLRHGLPPRPQSPPRKHVDRKAPTSEPRLLKRPLESADLTSSEKRARIEHNRTPSGSQMNSLRKTDNHSEKKPQSSPLKPSPQPRKTVSSSKGADNRDPPDAERPLRMPPLLSPLPADLDNGPLPIPKVKISEPGRSSSSNSPKPKTSNSTPPKSSATNNSPFVLPRLLSPTLPGIVEEELLRIHKKSTAAAQNTVEARHEKARRPDAPGVARKTPKVARKTNVEASKPQSVIDHKETLVIKLKYKKRRANDIARILKLESRPTKEFLRLEKDRIARTKLKDDSDDDSPQATIISRAPNPPPVSKKRPSDSFESRTSEPAAKRVKIPDPVEVSKQRPSTVPSGQAKSPIPSAPSQKSLLATPKKGDAMKSVIMRKIDSNDGHARTPQATSTSTPASVEKPRHNGDSRASMETEVLRSNVTNFDAQALKLKRKMDEILQTKQQKTRELLDSQKIHGLSVGLECVVMYMQSFAAKEKLGKHRSTTAWEGGIKLWEFIDSLTKSFPILNALSVQIGAICKEELGRAYIEALKDMRTPEFLQNLATNEMTRDRLWKQAQRMRPALDPLGIKEVTGPWTSVEECMVYTISALEKYARRDKTGWRAMN